MNVALLFGTFYCVAFYYLCHKASHTVEDNGMIKARVKVSPFVFVFALRKNYERCFRCAHCKEKYKILRHTHTTPVTKATDSKLPASQRQKQTLLI